MLVIVIKTKCAAIIDSCLDYDHADGSLDTEHAETVIEYLLRQKIKTSVDPRNTCTR